MTGRPTRPIVPWRVGLSLLGVGFAAGALALAGAQGQFSGGSRLSPGRTPARSASSSPTRPERGVLKVEPTIQAPPAASANPETAATVATSGSIVSGDVAALRMRGLDVPVEGVARSAVPDTYHQSRGSRTHEAVDILAPRGTPVHAVEDGRIAKLFFSNAGGITLYQFDSTEQYAYYYAHLDHYAPGLSEGEVVRRGQVLGYVGTTGNAPKDTPHLHFAIFKLGDDKKWWEGQPIDPFLVFKP